MLIKLVLDFSTVFLNYSLAQSRREDFEAVREAKKKDDMMRRQSMANKTEAAKQEREVQQDLDLKKKEQEIRDLDFRYTSWQDEKEHKMQEEMNRRQRLVVLNFY